MKSKKLPVILAVIAILAVVFLGMQSLSGGGDEPTGEPEEYVEYTFRNAKLLEEHFQKHGIEMGFATEEEYQKAASDVANNPDALHKLEKDDKDDVYYLEETNEFVVVSVDGFIRTYFCPDSGKKYFDKQ